MGTDRTRYCELLDFIGAGRGAAGLAYRGGDFRVEAVQLYSDGIRLAWQMSPEPDLSWLALDEENLRQRPSDERFAGLEKVHLKHRQFSALWRDSRLEDASGKEFVFLSSGRWSAGQSNAQGEVYCYCDAVPTDAGRLTLHLPGADYPIDLLHGIEPAVDREFHGGCPGPPSTYEFHGGELRVIAILAFRKRLVVEWSMQPLADLSWVELTAEQTAREHREPTVADALATQDRLRNLWQGAQLVDNRGGNYLSSPGVANRRGRGGAYRGEVYFQPPLTETATELNLALNDLSIFLPLC